MTCWDRSLSSSGLALVALAKFIPTPALAGDQSGRHRGAGGCGHRSAFRLEARLGGRALIDG